MLLLLHVLLLYLVLRVCAVYAARRARQGRWGCWWRPLGAVDAACRARQGRGRRRGRSGGSKVAGPCARLRERLVRARWWRWWSLLGYDSRRAQLQVRRSPCRLLLLLLWWWGWRWSLVLHGGRCLLWWLRDLWCLGHWCLGHWCLWRLHCCRSAGGGALGGLREPRVLARVGAGAVELARAHEADRVHPALLLLLRVAPHVVLAPVVQPQKLVLLLLL